MKLFKNSKKGFTRTPKLGVTPKGGGFTLIELLVVIAIISLLASVVSVALNSARVKARNARRVTDLREIRIALELYFDDNGTYPVANTWRSQCAGWGSYSQDQVIPGLVPTYMASIPADPAMDAVASTACYLYTSDGVNMKFLDRNIADMTLADVNGPFLSYKDPARNDLGGLPPCNFQNDDTISLSIWNGSAGMCW